MQQAIKMRATIVLLIMVVLTSFSAIAIDQSIFEDLPSKPDDFWLLTRELQENEYPDICKIKEEYFKQPDFYPTWDRNKVKYENIDYDKWTTCCYGAYPADMVYLMSHAPKGATFTLCTFLHASYSVETYQGIKLIPTDSEYWNIEIKPNEILLPPTSPKFFNGWARQITVTITAKKDVPKGKYNLGFNIGTPDGKTNTEYEWIMLSIPVKGEEEFADKCANNPGNSVELTRNECINKFRQRVNQYVAAGTWSTGRNAFNLELNIEQDTERIEETGFITKIKNFFVGLFS